MGRPNKRSRQHVCPCRRAQEKWHVDWTDCQQLQSSGLPVFRPGAWDLLRYQCQQHARSEKHGACSVLCCYWLVVAFGKLLLARFEFLTRRGASIQIRGFASFASSLSTGPSEEHSMMVSFTDFCFFLFLTPSNVGHPLSHTHSGQGRHLEFLLLGHDDYPFPPNTDSRGAPMSSKHVRWPAGHVKRRS